MYAPWLSERLQASDVGYTPPFVEQEQQQDSSASVACEWGPLTKNTYSAGCAGQPVYGTGCPRKDDFKTVAAAKGACEANENCFAVTSSGGDSSRIPF